MRTPTSEPFIRMSAKLRDVLELVAIRCSAIGNLEAEMCVTDLEHVLGGKVDQERQEVVYPLSDLVGPPDPDADLNRQSGESERRDNADLIHGRVFGAEPSYGPPPADPLLAKPEKNR